MMVTITNGRTTVRVSKSAFELMFKPAGFSIVNASPSAEGYRDADSGDGIPPLTPRDDDEAEDEETDNTSDEDEDEDEESEEERDYSETPLSEMGFDDLEAYADQLDIDHKGIRSKRDLRALIREHLKN